MGTTWTIDTNIISNGASHFLIDIDKQINVLLADRFAFYFSELIAERLNRMLLFNRCHAIPKYSWLREVIFERFTSISYDVTFHFFRIMLIPACFRRCRVWGVICQRIFMIVYLIHIDSISHRASPLIIMKWANRFIDR